jgi:hypothetical protein
MPMPIVSLVTILPSEKCHTVTVKLVGKMLKTVFLVLKSHPQMDLTISLNPNHLITNQPSKLMDYYHKSILKIMKLVLVSIIDTYSDYQEELN